MVTSMDYLVIGAGSAGMRLGHFLSQAGHDCLVVDAVAEVRKDKLFRAVDPNGEVIMAPTVIAASPLDIPGLDLATDGRSPARTSERESTNVPGVYFAGTLTQVRALHRILERKYHGVDWPNTCHQADPTVLTEVVLGRGSFLRRQFADVIVPAGRLASYYEEIPVDYLHDHALADDYFTITPNREPASPRTVIRHFFRATLLADHNAVENDLTSDAVRRRRLTEFFAERLLQTILTAATR
ncbi:FAD-dependent monooxygenase [Actinocrispum wychmicini]|uniref:FAD binding domain-containing protein n=1 Tax=Actinocrispum wychmicini TaxID=1213861 RepID=A0A4R2IXW8_9PSEU|nr:FAD-dependent monooxygenase [Actinocrispum wychmicini]TCO49822.1 FAD binding domain-containing protein [Actinocrispum wychmicini]